MAGIGKGYTSGKGRLCTKEGFTELASPYVSIVEEQQTKTMQVELDESKIESLLIPLLHEKYCVRYLQNNY